MNDDIKLFGSEIDAKPKYTINRSIKDISFVTLTGIIRCYKNNGKLTVVIKGDDGKALGLSITEFLDKWFEVHKDEKYIKFYKKLLQKRIYPDYFKDEER